MGMFFADSDMDPSNVWGAIVAIVLAALGPSGILVYWLRTNDKRKRDDLVARRKIEEDRRKADNDLLQRWRDIADLFQEKYDGVQKELQEKNVKIIKLEIMSEEQARQLKEALKRIDELEDALAKLGATNV